MGGFCTHWALNDDAITKLESLAPAVQQRVMAEFSPPAHMTEVNGRFIMFANSIDKAMRQDRMAHPWRPHLPAMYDRASLEGAMAQHSAFTAKRFFQAPVAQ